MLPKQVSGSVALPLPNAEVTGAVSLAPPLFLSSPGLPVFTRIKILKCRSPFCIFHKGVLLGDLHSSVETQCRQ